MTYSEKTLEIVKASIKSAVFIDEKARGIYEYDNLNDSVLEERLSMKVYEKFKEDGISLAIHKFKQSDRTNENLLKYLLEDRDLVLLDWKLEGEHGEEYSLELLERIVDSNHINFCCIYTTEPNIDNILLNVLSYFSGINQVIFETLNSDYVSENEEIIDEIKKTYNFIDFNNSINGKHLGKLHREGIIIEDLIELCGGRIDKKEALFLLMLASENYHKSSKANHKPSLISVESKSLIINNTIICILNKENALEETPIEIIKNLSDKIENSKNSFTQLLGIEMQNIFNSEGSFIDENLLKISKEALFAHRKHIQSTNDGNDIPFKTLIKQVLLEHAYLKLRTAKLSLLDEDFLATANDLSSILEDNQVALINTFYNSVSIKGLNENSQPNLNFGDIFKDKNGDYYLCITALCDCLRPDKIKNNYYFVKGERLSVVIANTLGDSAFISYVSEHEAISWIGLEPEKVIIIDDVDKSEQEILLEKLVIENKILSKYKYLPVYVKPHSFNVKDPKITNSMIEIRRIESIKVEEVIKDNGDIAFSEITYITTLRPNYVQRIANHAFAHPVRVGVDFVKK
ncbi:response regulator receiver domain [Flavobacterium algicola]|uniref:response regulator receiver domain n=1 Tax=Flavobacterium algicola TaxID=556529 RepID=UPI001EFD7F90|nr:response regulator receiver domain [Flavobacterium algicola]MCG9793547.1 response regulator receiver domain [Flavobacterium algicola]